MERRLWIAITGDVQGVGFRYFLRREALARGISGFAKNERDGSVVVEAQGKEENLALFLARCREGPPYARVFTVSSHEIPVVPAEQGFVVQ